MGHPKTTLGLIVGNRGFFPGHLAESGRAEMLKVLEQAGVDVVVLDAAQSKHGAIETYEEATRCAEHFRANGERIDGVIVTLPNFGDERAIADTLRLSRLKVPVLVQATPDTPPSRSPFAAGIKPAAPPTPPVSPCLLRPVHLFQPSYCSLIPIGRLASSRGCTPITLVRHPVSFAYRGKIAVFERGAEWQLLPASCGWLCWAREKWAEY